MNVLSLFDGMGCARIALDRANIEVNNYFASEIDKNAIKVSTKNYPDIQQLGTICDWGEWNLPKIDLIIAGSPCQGLSSAGKRMGFNDPRSRLFYDFVGCINKFVPAEFIFENVRMKKDDLKLVSQILECEPTFINSSLVSAQNRQRLYWTKHNIILPTDQGICLQDILEYGIVDRNKSYCVDANYAKGGNLRRYIQKSSRQLVFEELPIVKNSKFRKLTITECERLQTVPDEYTKGVVPGQRYKMLGNGFTVDVIAHILKCIYKGE